MRWSAGRTPLYFTKKEDDGMDKMSLRQMEFFAYHGVFPEENRLGQRFIVDVELSMDLTKAGQSDELEHTINYAELYEHIRRIVETETFRLIEAVAEAIATRTLQLYTVINEMTVRVTKPSPPFRASFQGVTVEIHRDRSHVQ
jgi:7,8-dihydroneopterin aldolase/epimerase/oxygenase